MNGTVKLGIMAPIVLAIPEPQRGGSHAFVCELARGLTPPDAIARTMATAGRTVAVSGLTVAVSLSGLLIFPQVFLRSMGAGGIAAVLVAVVAALTVLPALLAVLGRRVEAAILDHANPRVPWPGWPAA